MNMSEYLELAKVFTGVATAGVMGTAGYLIARGLGERTKSQYAENNIASVEHQLEIPKVIKDLMDNNEDIGSVFFADGERAVIALPEAQEHGDNKPKRINQATFHLRHDGLVMNYSMALRDDLTNPQGIYNRADNPEPLENFSRKSIKTAEEVRKGAWVDNPERKKTDLYTRQNKNTEILRGAHNVMIQVLKDIADENLYPEEGFVQSRDIWAVKYKGDDGKAHVVAIPSNAEQHSVLTKIYGEGVQDPKDILEAIMEHYRETLYPDGTIYTLEAEARHVALINGDIPEEEVHSPVVA